MKQKNSESQQVENRQGLRQALIVASQTPKTSHPGERALDHPSTRQEHEAALGLRQLDHFQADTMLFGCIGGCVTGIASIHIGQLHMVSGRLLHLCRQNACLSPILLISWGHMQSQEMATSVSTARWTLLPFRRAGSIIASSM